MLTVLIVADHQLVTGNLIALHFSLSSVLHLQCHLPLKSICFNSMIRSSSIPFPRTMSPEIFSNLDCVLKICDSQEVRAVDRRRRTETCSLLPGKARRCSYVFLSQLARRVVPSYYSSIYVSMFSFNWILLFHHQRNIVYYNALVSCVTVSLYNADLLDWISHSILY